MIDLVYAMAQSPKGGEQAGSPLGGFLPLIMIFAVFYFLLIRPQKKQAKNQKNMINSLKKGDLVITSGGIHGKITALKGKQIEVEIASNTKVIINRSAVSQLMNEGEILGDEKEKK